MLSSGGSRILGIFLSRGNSIGFPMRQKMLCIDALAPEEDVRFVLPLGKSNREGE